MKTRTLIATMLAAALLPGASGAQAPAWPTKPVRIITGWTPGGNADAISRLLANQFAKRVPHSVIVDNRPGASGTIAAGMVVRAEPDGNTLLVASMVEVTVVPPATVQSMGYDPETDLQPVTMVGRWPLVLVANAGVPAGTMAELVGYAKANPGKVSYGSLGNASINHLTGELLNLTAGIGAVHVPYKGNAPMMSDLVSGQIHYAFDSLGSTQSLVRAGRIKALAVTDSKRLEALPNVPTTAEAGFPGVATGVWIGLFVPAKTPKNILDALHAETLQALGAPEVRKALADRAILTVGNSVEEFKREIQVETRKKRELAARIGLKPE
jgi:tripartite-type tricarboxylate transporter receptor subunit TctC